LRTATARDEEIALRKAENKWRSRRGGGGGGYECLGKGVELELVAECHSALHLLTGRENNVLVTDEDPKIGGKKMKENGGRLS